MRLEVSCLGGKEPCRGTAGVKEGISLGGRTRDWNRASRGSPAGACRGVSSGRTLGNDRGDELWVSMSSCWTEPPGRAAAPGTRRPSPGPRVRVSVRARAALTASAMALRGPARPGVAATAAAARPHAGRPRPRLGRRPPARPSSPARARAAVGPGLLLRAGGDGAAEPGGGVGAGRAAGRAARRAASGLEQGPALSTGPRPARGPRAAAAATPAPAASCAAVPAPLQQGSCTAAAMLIQTASWEACPSQAV